MPVYRRGDTWWVRFQNNGKRHSFSAGTGATYEQAKALEAQTRQAIISGKLGQQTYTLEDAAVRWLEGEAKGIKHYKKLLQTIKLIRPHIQDTPIDKAQDAAQRIRKAYRHLNAATVNRRLAIVRRLCNLAWKWGWVQRQIKIELLSGEKTRHVYLSIPQVIKLAKAAPKSKWHIILAAFTGLREGELLSLKQENMVSGLIILNQTKNGKPRVIPLNKPAQCALNRLDWSVTYPMLRKEFEKARVDADIRFHDLRHTAASFMVKGGASLVAVRDILGHSNLGVTGRYSHLAIDDLKIAVDKMMGGTKMVQANKARKPV
ncbi:MAG: site-specific integrase [Methylotenera sp.]